MRPSPAPPAPPAESPAEPIVVWGAGAIGGTIGAMLRHAGHPVHFVDIVPEHVAAIRAGALHLEGPVAQVGVAAPADLPADLRGRFKLILLAVKAHHTEDATRALLPHLADDGAVVSCQNGLNELVIADLAGRARTIGCFVNFYADYLAPGRILYAKRGAVVVGELDGRTTARIAALHRLLQTFEPDAVLSDNIFGYLWGKAGYGAILKASALTDDTIADFIADPARRAMLIALVREVLAVARAEGVVPLGFDGFDPDAFLANDAAIAAAWRRSTAAPPSRAAASGAISPCASAAATSPPSSRRSAPRRAAMDSKRRSPTGWWR